jgi:hypothetical protein
MGILANDTHDFMLWIKDEKLAQLCRCSTKTVQRAKRQMVKDGFIRLVEPPYAQHPAIYQFLFPGKGGHSERPNRAEGGHLRRRGWTSEDSTPIYRNELKRSETAFSESSQSVSMPAGFRESLGLVKTLDHGLATH